MIPKVLVVLLSIFIAACSTPTPQVIVVTATPPSSPAPRESILWVCVDIAVGYESQNEQSRIVWRMSKRDGWQFTGSDVPNPWIHITLEDGRNAFMKRADLCNISSNPGDAATRPSTCPSGCEIPLPGCLIKGNISSSTGAKIFHVPGQNFYASTAINPNNGERWFCTEAEAIANGWRKSKE